ncbi:Vacuolar protein-sorting-associated protein 28 [Apophysomyces ossiformis]|uniref:Vacuolar protein sorting-associated protein 28 n=1 Tax=Apophysomyces ossiformis TaxID=679940 RepID=A0A8H7BV72_9FUNG|nr:Vacuolar protein-sorting-associated protein 28 [Apophysomyces ossiformis]
MESPTTTENVPSYAPTFSTNTKSINLDEEVRLFSNNKDREKYDNMADLFAIIVLMEHLEKAFIRDSITPEAYDRKSGYSITYTQIPFRYTPQCSNLIAKYKTTMNFLSNSITNLETFMNDYKLSCPAAVNRFKIGVPATYEHAVGHNTNDVGNSAKHVADIVTSFVTLTDTLQLRRFAVDDLYPILSDLIKALNKMPSLPADFGGKVKVREWLITLHSMQASDEITEKQSRQMLFDMEQSHNEFYRLLSGEHKAEDVMD